MTDHQKIVTQKIREELMAMIRKSFETLNPGQPFLMNWHHWAIIHHLELCLQ